MRRSQLEPDLISYSVAISACEKGRQWMPALSLLQAMRSSQIERHVISYAAAIRAGENRFEPNGISYSADTSAFYS